MSNILDLSGADTSGYDAAEPGSYACTVAKIELGETSNPNGKLPQGVPMPKVQFKPVEGAGYKGLFFDNYPLPTDEQHPQASKMRGRFVNFLVALGEDKATLLKKGFNTNNLEDLQGRECVVRVSKEPQEIEEIDGEEKVVSWQNRVKAVKPAGSDTGTVESGIL